MIRAMLMAAMLAGSALHFPTRFDDIGPAMQTAPGEHGRTVHYADTGEAGWRPVLFIGGTGTSARAMLMTGYLDSLRRQLHLRLISVERDGFGETPITPGWQLSDYPADVRAVLDRLKVARFSIVAISGGGPYAAHVAAAMPGRIASLHFAAALSDAPSSALPCGASDEQLAAGLAKSVGNPQSWWAFPAESPTHAIPGFSDRAYDEGARAFFIAGQMGNAKAEAAEMRRYCKADLGALAPTLATIKAPVFTYYGLADTSVTPGNARFWQEHFGGPVTPRTYPGEGHDVQYRHWDQILLDLAGRGAGTLLCERGREAMVPNSQANAMIAKGSGVGLCLWRREPVRR